jgi:hypothetical protein
MPADQEEETGTKSSSRKSEKEMRRETAVSFVAAGELEVLYAPPAM